MSIRETIIDYPAFKVVEPDVHNGAKVILDDVDLYVGGSKFRAGSVMSYAIKNGECPFESYDHAIKNEHDVYYIYGLGVSLTSSKGEKKVLYGYNVGDLVKFQGKLFKLEEAPNNNLRFAPAS